MFVESAKGVTVKFNFISYFFSSYFWSGNQLSKSVSDFDYKTPFSFPQLAKVNMMIKF